MENILRKRRTGRRVVLAVAVAMIAAQLVPYGRDHSNPPVLGEPAWDGPATRATFHRACGDSHSNTTRWPWYSHVAPASWLVAYDVRQGRSHFNVSEWGRPENEGDEAAELVEKGEMPLWYYRPAHPEARLSKTDKAEFLRGLAATFGQSDGHGAHERDHDREAQDTD
jgi:hypothetical protein